MNLDYLLDFKPILVGNYECIPVSEEEVLFKTPLNEFTYSGASVGWLINEFLPLLDGKRKVREICDFCREKYEVDPEEILFLISELTQQKFVCVAADSEEDADTLTPKEKEFYKDQIDLLGNYGDGNIIQSRIKSSGVTVISAGRLGYAIAGELAALGVGSLRVAVPERIVNLKVECDHEAQRKRIKSINPGIKVDFSSDPVEKKKDLEPLVEEKRLVIVATATALDFLPNLVNEICLEKGNNWLRVHLDLFRGELGPFFIPGQTACFKCMTLRGMSVLFNPLSYQAHQQKLEKDEINVLKTQSNFSVERMLSWYVAQEIARWYSGYFPDLFGYIKSFNFLTYQNLMHRILKVPRCPACGKHKDSTTQFDFDYKAFHYLANG